jgi:hypothetical protein
MVTDNNDHQDKFIAYDDYAEDVSGKRYNRKMFSPGDVASLIGREYLSQEVTRSNSAASQSRQVKTSGSSYTITQWVTSESHRYNEKQYQNLWNCIKTNYN